MKRGSYQESVHVTVGVEGRKRPNIRHIPESTSPSDWASNSCQEERRLDGKGAAHAFMLICSQTLRKSALRSVEHAWPFPVGRRQQTDLPHRSCIHS